MANTISRVIYLKTVINLKLLLAVVAVGMLSFVIGGGLFFGISEDLSSGTRQYQVAYKTSSESDFNYAKNTKVGNVLAEGTFACDRPVSDERIEGVYTAIRVDIDRYTMHTTTRTDAKGRVQITTYYSWDWTDTEYNRAESFSFLGQTGDVSGLGNIYSSEETIYDGSIRYRISTIPTSFYGVGFWSAGDDLQINEAWRDQTVDQVMSSEVESASIIPVIFVVIWDIVTVIAIGLFLIFNDDKILMKRKR